MSSRTPARLSSGLLSRKGMAAPSAGPEARANRVGAPDAPDAPGAETTRPQLRQGPAPARSTLTDWAAPEPAPSAGAQDRHDQMTQKRVRVSLRLDEDRHARLKLVATQRNCTLQSLFTEAIDEFFIRHAPDLHGISAHLRRGTAATGTAATASGRKVRRGKRNSEGRNGPSQSR
jgi:predicted DNA-binding ribbon-helix-helix protein